jgi:type II secretory pathway pseudopilin PulG
MLKNLKQSGETIIEVLIAVAVMSGTLAGAFAIATKSQSTVQANQERYQAQLFANQQADLMKLANAEGLVSGAYINTSSYFCMYTTNVSGVVKVNITGLTSRATLDANCKIDSGSGFSYEVFITSATASAGNQKYLITVEWDSLVNSTSGKDTVRLVYGIK